MEACAKKLRRRWRHGPNTTISQTLWGGGHEATETGLAYAPVSQAHGHNHIVQCFSRCTAAQAVSVPHQVVADCALALVLWTLRSARTHHPPTVPYGGGRGGAGGVSHTRTGPSRPPPPPPCRHLLQFVHSIKHLMHHWLRAVFILSCTKSGCHRDLHLVHQVRHLMCTFYCKEEQQAELGGISVSPDTNYLPSR